MKDYNLTLIPQCIFLGPGFNKLTITLGGHKLAELLSDEGTQAHSIQFGLFYIFGLSLKVDKSKKGKELQQAKRIQNFFEFASLYIWNMQLSKEYGGKLRKERVSSEVLSLWNKMNSSESSSEDE